MSLYNWYGNNVDFLLWAMDIVFYRQRKLDYFLGMAVLPVVYFILAEIWLQNYLAIIPTVLFGIVHVINTYLSIAN